MDPTLDLERRRLLISAALTAQARRRLGDSLADGSGPAKLLDLADRLKEGAGPVERGYRLSFDPAYPGITAGPQIIGRTCRLLLACRAYHDGTTIGVVFTALIAGRAPQVSVAPAEASIPEGWWLPADSR
jgi:hypothetical protein